MSFAFTEFLKLQKILTSVNRSISDFGAFTFTNSCARFWFIEPLDNWFYIKYQPSLDQGVAIALCAPHVAGPALCNEICLRKLDSGIGLEGKNISPFFLQRQLMIRCAVTLLSSLYYHKETCYYGFRRIQNTCKVWYRPDSLSWFIIDCRSSVEEQEPSSQQMETLRQGSCFPSLE